MFNAEISAGSLLLPESRRLARLLLTQPSPEAWRQALYPMLRTHTLLSALHPHMRHTPLLMLYPGRYDGQSLSLFNTLSDDNYYRAFRLVS